MADDNPFGRDAEDARPAAGVPPQPLPPPPPPPPPPRSATTAQPLVQFDTVSKRFGSFVAVDSVLLDIHEGEFFALLGPSGCGKTTLLRMLAGFERPSEGRVLLSGEDISGVPPHKRPVNMMFQSYALFPHLTVAGNVAFGLRQDGMPKDEIDTRVSEMLALVRLDGLGERRPHQLSGGQRQRVALARALAKRPKVLLLDEPLSALDRKLREETRFELMELQKRLGLTFIVVTHDQEEAMTVADRIGIMNSGRLVQVAPPAVVYEQPDSRWVAGFIGDVNLFEGRVTTSGLGHAMVESVAGGRIAVSHAADLAPGTHVWVALRPEKIELDTKAPVAGAENSFSGRVSEIGYLGGTSICKIWLDNGIEMKAAVVNRDRKAAQVSATDRVWLSFKPEACVLLMR
jgi:putrescine transport system ATP-binding protein